MRLDAENVHSMARLENAIIKTEMADTATVNKRSISCWWRLTANHAQIKISDLKKALKAYFHPERSSNHVSFRSQSLSSASYHNPIGGVVST